VPIVVYPTNAEAEIVKGKIAIKYLKIDTEKYEYFENLRRGNVDPRDFDHIVSCSDTQYQKLHFSKIEGEKAAWQRNDKTRGRVIKLFKDVAMYMLPDVARTLTEEEYLQKVGAAPAVEQQASGVDLDDMLGEDD
jgi:phospholipase C